MPAAVSITREDYTAAELRREAKRTDDADVSRRMLALALVLEGKSRGEAAISCGMDRQVLRDWVHRYRVKLAERSVGDLLRRLGFRRLSVRPRCPEQDAATQEAHKKTFPIWSRPASRRTRAASRSSFGGRMRPVSVSKAR